jgi:uncharacterized cupredoxin-like copper-binding protein
MLKKIKWLVLAAMIAGGVYIYQNAGSFITKQAEKIASGALGVAVDIGRIDVSIADKKVSVQGITVANVPGYKQPYIVRAEGLDIGLNTASKELIDFNNIRLRGAHVYVEATEKGINVNDLKKRMNAKKQKESAGSKQVRVIIDHMIIDASTIHPSVSLLGKEIAAIKLPALTFSNIGKGGGVTAGAAVQQIVAHYVASAEKAVQSAGLLSPVKEVEKKLRGVTDKLNVKGLF